MSRVRVIVNGQKVMADSEQTIMDVVHANNLDHIPNLCYEQQLHPYNSCFLCLVEVKGIPKLVPACSTKVRDNMEIFTQTEKVMKGRRTSLELLLSNHYADCLAPCSMTCPAGVDVQGYIALISAGQYQEAVKLIKNTNPLPAVCGRVCTRPCELACRRNIIDKHVGIDYLKRFVADFDLQKALAHVKPDIEKEKDTKIAIIGAGPAGLSAAYFLRKYGYGVSIFEAMPEAGGMLRYGIPEYRLPYDILDKEIDTIVELGVELRTNMALGDDFTIKSLFNDGYRAVFLALGAWGSRRLGVQGQDAEGVLSGIQFLEEIGRGKTPDIYGKVVVVGGGNTAIDCARTSLRLGAEKVVLLYRRSRKEMPANELEIEAAIHEGVEMEFLITPIEVLTRNNRVVGLKCIKMKLGEPDASGRRRPIMIPGSETTVECDFVFAAIGQHPKVELLSEDKETMYPNNDQLSFTRWNTVVVKPETFETNVDSVFAGGDMVTGAATVIEAIAGGRKAAFAINSYLQKGVVAAEPKYFNSRKDDFKEVGVKDLRYSHSIPFNPMPELSPKERIEGFKEVELGYSEEQALQESSRCLECGCNTLFECKLRKYASEYKIDIKKYQGEFDEHEIDRSHPLIELDQNKCILCARCIRICSEIVGEAVFGFYGRGFSTAVSPEMGKQLVETSCISCGLCISTCPTGAISVKSDAPKPGPWELEYVPTTCAFCGVGCVMEIGIKGNRFIKISTEAFDSPTHGNTCKAGRFGYRFIHDPGRFDRALEKKNGEKVECSMEDAVQSMVRDVYSVKNKYTGDEVAVCISPRLTNEEIYLLQKFARVILQTPNVFSISKEINHELFNPAIHSQASYQDVEESEVLFITLANFRRDHLVVDFMIRRAQYLGSKIIYLGQEDNPLTSICDKFIKIQPGMEAYVLQGLMKILVEKGPAKIKENVDKNILEAIQRINLKYIEKIAQVSQDDIESVAELLLNKNKIVYLADRQFPGNRTREDVPLLAALSMLTNGLTAFVDEHCNSQGIVDLGAHPKLFPGYFSTDNVDAVKYFEKQWAASLSEMPKPQLSFLNSLKEGKWKAVFLWGEDIPESYAPYLNKVEYLFVSDAYMTETLKQADLAVPLCTAPETKGSFTNGLRRISPVFKTVHPKSGFENWQVIVRCAVELGMRFRFNYQSVEDIQNEMKRILPIYSDVSFDQVSSWETWDLSALSDDFNQLSIVKNVLAKQTLTSISVTPTVSTNALRKHFKIYWQQLWAEKNKKR